MRSLKKFGLIITWICLSGWGFSQETADGPAAMMKHMTPGKYHSLLAEMAGEWTFESKIWMAPGQPPMTTSGTSTYAMIFGGRFLQQDFRGDMMGMPLLGRGITAYDNSREVFLSTWIDNMGTSIATGEGSYDEEKKIIHMKGTMTNGMNGEVEPYRFTIEMKDKDHMIFTMYGSSGGQEIRSMEIVYNRVK